MKILAWPIIWLIVHCGAQAQVTRFEAGGNPATADQRPNVLMIAVDDMNDWIGCLGGHPDVQTPNIDRLAARGLLFANAHCAAPVCNPSRVAIMTGRLPSTTGVYDNSVRWHEELEGIVSLPLHFRHGGYYVIGGGKINHHMPGFNRAEDWDEYKDQVFDSHYQAQLARGDDVANFDWPQGFPLNQLEEVRLFSKPPKNANEFDWGPSSQADLEMGDGQLVEWLVRFLAQPKAQPFFMAAGIYRPHLPLYAPEAYFAMYPPEKLELPPVKSNDVDDLPPIGKKMAADRREDLQLLFRHDRYREFIQAYLANISYADALIGRLIDALDASPAGENTIIVFWSDHGWHLGEKEHLHKFTLWERSTRIPLIVVAPGVTGERTRSLRPVSLIDLFPTLSELCQLDSLSEWDGASLVPLLREPEMPWDRAAVTTHGFGNHAVRTDRWRYIRYEDGGEELYDHRSDPHEWTNLANDPAYSAVRRELAEHLPASDARPLKSKKK